jgi:starch synthase
MTISKKRILFIAAEMSPYLELTEYAEVVNKLAVKCNESGYEVRCIMPRFGVINERRHRLHEVVRLSGINVSIENDDYPLQIKVASLPNARLQVYFLDNEDFFKRKAVFTDDDEQWFDDNGLRTIFFCKGALETVKKFGWPPDIIHCSGWMTGLIPYYLKTAYKREPVFSQNKIIYTIGENDSATHTFEKDFVEKANISSKEKGMEELLKKPTNTALYKIGALYADAIAIGTEHIDKKLLDEVSKMKGKKIIPYKEEIDLTEYLDLYHELAPN